MRTKFKAWTKPYLDEHQEMSLKDEEINKLDNFYLEIGSGKGDFLIQMSNKYPDLFFLGIEKNVTCAGITTKKLVDNEIKNVKLLYADFERISPLIKDESVEIIFLNFSDPWPKKRHHKRRLTSTKFLDEYKRILKPNGKLIFKSDNADLFAYSIEMLEEAHFHIESITNDYDGSDPFDAATEYETFFREEGTKINRVVVKKNG